MNINFTIHGPSRINCWKDDINYSFCWHSSLDRTWDFDMCIYPNSWSFKITNSWCWSYEI